MTAHDDVRESRRGDAGAIDRLYSRAFPDEDLRPLVRELLGEKSGVLSLVSAVGDDVTGHIAFTACGVAGDTDRNALLGPLAVAPEWQRQGFGGKLIRAGLERMKTAGMARIFVLGDPAYYRRFGFAPERAVTPPYPLPDEWRGAWQSLPLSQAGPSRGGRLRVPAPWDHAALWAP